MDVQQFERESREFQERRVLWRQQTDEIMDALDDNMSLKNVWAATKHLGTSAVMLTQGVSLVVRTIPLLVRGGDQETH